MTKVGRFVENLFEGVGVYLFTFMGILLSQYGPMLGKRDPINVKLEWIRLAISAAMALYIVMKDESKGDAEGRKNNLKRRLGKAFSNGVSFNVISGIGIQAIQAAGG